MASDLTPEVTNPPAFPSEQHETLSGTWNQTYCDGMSLRDWFAGKVVSGIMVGSYGGATMTVPMANAIAREGYLIADAMLVERMRS